jgi:hypothetical protein
MAYLTSAGAPHPSTRLVPLLGLLIVPLVAACASVPLEPAGSLSSYGEFTPSNGVLTHAQVSVSKDVILAATTVHIVPTSFAATAAEPKVTESQRRLIANAVDRSLCVDLGDRFHIVAPGEGADLTVHAFITRIIPTDEIAAGASKAASTAVSIASAVGAITVPVPSLRGPIGLGGLALEAEALDRSGSQKAAMMWARGADAVTSRPRVSSAGDAYDLASSFAEDFSKLMLTGASPFQTLPSPPSFQRVGAMLGGAPKESACEVFGRGAGVAGLVGGALGLPPEWADKGAQAPPDAQAMK